MGSSRLPDLQPRVSVPLPLPARAPLQQSAKTTVAVAGWRLALVACCLAAAALALRLGDPAAYLQADPELARVLRGMALIKTLLVLAAVAVVAWRYSWPLSRGLHAAYLVGASLMAFASASIWQLSFFALASIAFHAGIVLLLVAAYMDNGRQQRGAPASRK
jgi:hypothetical protein